MILYGVLGLQGMFNETSAAENRGSHPAVLLYALCSTLDAKY